MGNSQLFWATRLSWRISAWWQAHHNVCGIWGCSPGTVSSPLATPLELALTWALWGSPCHCYLSVDNCCIVYPWAERFPSRKLNKSAKLMLVGQSVLWQSTALKQLKISLLFLNSMYAWPIRYCTACFQTLKLQQLEGWHLALMLITETKDSIQSKVLNAKDWCFGY